MQSFGFPHSLVVARVSTRVKICKIILEKWFTLSLRYQVDSEMEQHSTVTDLNSSQNKHASFKMVKTIRWLYYEVP